MPDPGQDEARQVTYRAQCTGCYRWFLNDVGGSTYCLRCLKNEVERQRQAALENFDRAEAAERERDEALAERNWNENEAMTIKAKYVAAEARLSALTEALRENIEPKIAEAYRRGWYDGADRTPFIETSPNKKAPEVARKLTDMALSAARNALGEDTNGPS